MIFLIFVILSVAYQYLLFSHYSTYIFDLGMWNRHFWGVAHLDFGVNPTKGFPLLGDHAHFLMLALVPIYSIFQSPEFFFYVQSVAVGLSIFPVYHILVKYFGKLDIHYVLIITYLSFFGFWSAFTYPFHEVVVAVPIIAWIFYFYLENRWRPFIIACLMLLLLREDMPLYIVAFSLLVIIKKRQFRIGVSLLVLSVIYYFAITKYVMPSIAGFTYFLNDTPLGSTTGEILRNSIEHPKLVITSFFQPNIKIEVIIILLTSFGFLTLLAPEALLVLMVPLAARFLSVQEYRWGFSEHYSVTQGPILMIGAILGASVLVSFLQKRLILNKSRQRTIVVSIACLVVTGAFLGNSVAQQRYTTFARFNSLDSFKLNDDIRAANQAVGVIPSNASVLASSSFPQLTSRKEIYLWTAKTSQETIRRHRPEYIIISTILDDAYMPETRDEITAAIRNDGKLGYETIFSRNGAIVLKRTR